ncbi:unnamed protein product [Clonostachys byssicola]|uniref:Amino acid permease/ SLC12A domain-containing protein n=1 Tax=Clonostachys byssicola TaxID=160290 RepID=A0A9N9U5W7_9HYPO|nr:unnamed protein product [Clonostachys byssicola]
MEINNAGMETKLNQTDEAQRAPRQGTSQGILLDADCINSQYGHTDRGLSPRHVQLMAIGGAIGVGLFVGVGAVMTKTGPLSLLLGYSFCCLLFVWPTNLCLAEMCSYLPLNASIFQLASRFIDPAVGFAMGWTYLFASVMLVCVEYSAVATIMSYWLPDVNPAAWVAMSMATCLLLNIVASGIPIWCVLSVSLVTCITFMVASNDGVKVFFWFVDMTTGGLVFTYILMLATFLAWHRARKAQGFPSSKLYYVAPLQPYTAMMAMSLGILVLLTLGFDVFYPFDIRGFITSYFCIPYTIVLFIGWKIAKKTSYIKPEDADFVTGKKEIDADCLRWESGGIEENWEEHLRGLTFWRRCWERMW